MATLVFPKTIQPLGCCCCPMVDTECCDVLIPAALRFFVGGSEGILHFDENFDAWFGTTSAGFCKPVYEVTMRCVCQSGGHPDCCPVSGEDGECCFVVAINKLPTGPSSDFECLTVDCGPPFTASATVPLGSGESVGITIGGLQQQSKTCDCCCFESFPSVDLTFEPFGDDECNQCADIGPGLIRFGVFQAGGAGCARLACDEYLADITCLPYDCDHEMGNDPGVNWLLRLGLHGSTPGHCKVAVQLLYNANHPICDGREECEIVGSWEAEIPRGACNSTTIRSYTLTGGGDHWLCDVPSTVVLTPSNEVCAMAMAMDDGTQFNSIDLGEPRQFPFGESYAADFTAFGLGDEPHLLLHQTPCREIFDWGLYLDAVVGGRDGVLDLDATFSGRTIRLELTFLPMEPGEEQRTIQLVAAWESGCCNKFSFVKCYDSGLIPGLPQNLHGRTTGNAGPALHRYRCSNCGHFKNDPGDLEGTVCPNCGV